LGNPRARGLVPRLGNHSHEARGFAKAVFYFVVHSELCGATPLRRRRQGSTGRFVVRVHAAQLRVNHGQRAVFVGRETGPCESKD
jgi:hypothetical protein